jgi:glutaredoxin 3
MGNIVSGSSGGNSASNNSAMAAGQDPRAFIDSEIATHPVVVFSKTWCGYCSATKRLFQMNYPVTPVILHELDKMVGGEAIQQALLEKTGQRTVPSVFVAGQHIGGNDETTQAHKSGKLAQLMQQARENFSK